MGAQPIVADSARKHGVSDDDMVHAFNNPVRAYELDEGLTLLIGPSLAGQVLEVGVVDGELAPVIVHAMSAREKFLR